MVVYRIMVSGWGAHNAPMNREWHQEGAYPWKSIIGGDGMQIQIDKRNPS